jgi:hypothetical protein
MGVMRSIEGSRSGRAFLQEHGMRFEQPPNVGNYFASLRSPRRLNLAREISRSVKDEVSSQVPNRLAHIPELANYVCHACDGHWHEAASHDPRHEDRKVAVGHFYSLNLHTHTLSHLAAGHGLHEHDMSALKRIKPAGLRQGVPKGKRAITIYDKAGIDLDYWNRCRRECAVYFLSRVKENMVFEWVEDRPWDKSDARNHGVIADWKVRSRQGHSLRIVLYQHPEAGDFYEYLTNEFDLPPGIIVELYRKRWDVEKTFDEVKNKLGQTKAWGSSLEAKEIQALMIAITHNLMLAYEQHLEVQYGVINAAEDQRRERRNQASRQACARWGRQWSTLLEHSHCATQRSVKFIRWLRQSIRDRVTEATAAARLKALYATL